MCRDPASNSFARDDLEREYHGESKDEVAKTPTIDTALLDTLRSDFAGEVIVPGDAGYDSARRIWNASIDKHPGVIARCSGVADICQRRKVCTSEQSAGVGSRRRPQCRRPRPLRRRHRH